MGGNKDIMAVVALIHKFFKSFKKVVDTIVFLKSRFDNRETPVRAKELAGKWEQLKKWEAAHSSH